MQNPPTLTCAIVDDEPIAIEGLTRQLQAIEFLTLTASFKNPIEASNFLEANKVDLLFLDVSMPQLNGISLLKSLSNKPMVIFTTAYPIHAVEAFGLDALDYLLKPFSFESLMRAVNKAVVKLNAKTVEKVIDYTFVRSEGKYHKLYFNDVEYIEGMKDYVKVHSAGGVIAVAMNLSDIIEKFPKDVFSRVHKSYIVNKNKIANLNSYELILGAATIPIGAAYRDNLHAEVLFDRVTTK
ncbi:MAG TPA: LytTR family DNA-binding domain-containing protein [Chitinophagales bacterium]|nr:LytTR family DNA-binding domain-containing protein [Chitinophagales bacterium]